MTNFSSNDEARYWAENLAESEGEAFERAIKASIIKKTDFETDDLLEQTFREGYLKGVEIAQKESLEKFNSILEENIELRRQLKTISEMNNRLREAIIRNSEEEWD